MNLVLGLASCASALTVASAAQAETSVAGGALERSTTWTLAGSPYRVRGDLIVPVTATLTIEPGVRVILDPVDTRSSGMDPRYVELDVFGGIDCVGTASQPIVFSLEDESSLWYGLILRAGSRASVAHSYFLRAESAITVNTDARIADSIIGWPGSFGVLVRERSAEIDRVTIVGPSEATGVRVEENASARIRNVLIAALGSGVHVSQGLLSPAATEITHVTIDGVVGDCVRRDAVSSAHNVVVRNSTLTHCGAYGLRAVGEAPAGRPALEVIATNVFASSQESIGVDASTVVWRFEPGFVGNGTAPGHYDLSPTSSLVDRANVFAAGTLDVRRAPRAVDGDRLGGSEPDVGAFEYQAGGFDGGFPGMDLGLLRGREVRDGGVDAGGVRDASSLDASATADAQALADVSLDVREAAIRDDRGVVAPRDAVSDVVVEVDADRTRITGGGCTCSIERRSAHGSWTHFLVGLVSLVGSLRARWAARGRSPRKCGAEI